LKTYVGSCRRRQWIDLSQGLPARTPPQSKALARKPSTKSTSVKTPARFTRTLHWWPPSSPPRSSQRHRGKLLPKILQEADPRMPLGVVDPRMHLEVDRKDLLLLLFQMFQQAVFSLPPEIQLARSSSSKDLLPLLAQEWRGRPFLLLVLFHYFKWPFLRSVEPCFILLWRKSLNDQKHNQQSPISHCAIYQQYLLIYFEEYPREANWIKIKRKSGRQRQNGPSPRLAAASAWSCAAGPSAVEMWTCCCLLNSSASAWTRQSFWSSQSFCGKLCPHWRCSSPPSDSSPYPSGPRTRFSSSAYPHSFPLLTIVPPMNLPRCQKPQRCSHWSQGSHSDSWLLWTESILPLLPHGHPPHSQLFLVVSSYCKKDPQFIWKSIAQYPPN